MWRPPRRRRRLLLGRVGARACVGGGRAPRMRRAGAHPLKRCERRLSMESLRVGVGAHPSLKNERSCGFGSDEALAARVRTPLLLLSAGNDPPNVQPGGAVARALAASGGAGPCIRTSTLRHVFDWLCSALLRLVCPRAVRLVPPSTRFCSCRRSRARFPDDGPRVGHARRRRRRRGRRRGGEGPRGVTRFPVGARVDQRTLASRGRGSRAGAVTACMCMYLPP